MRKYYVAHDTLKYEGEQPELFVVYADKSKMPADWYELILGPFDTWGQAHRQWCDAITTRILEQARILERASLTTYKSGGGWEYSDDNPSRRVLKRWDMIGVDNELLNN